MPSRNENYATMDKLYNRYTLLWINCLLLNHIIIIIIIIIINFIIIIIIIIIICIIINLRSPSESVYLKWLEYASHHQSEVYWFDPRHLSPGKLNG